MTRKTLGAVRIKIYLNLLLYYFWIQLIHKNTDKLLATSKQQVQTAIHHDPQMAVEVEGEKRLNVHMCMCHTSKFLIP